MLWIYLPTFWSDNARCIPGLSFDRGCGNVSKESALLRRLHVAPRLALYNFQTAFHFAHRARRPRAMAHRSQHSYEDGTVGDASDGTRVVPSNKEPFMDAFLESHEVSMIF